MPPVITAGGTRDIQLGKLTLCQLGYSHSGVTPGDIVRLSAMAIQSGTGTSDNAHANGEVARVPTMPPWMASAPQAGT